MTVTTEDMKAVQDRYLSKFEVMIDLERQQKVRAGCEKVFEFEPMETLPFVLSDPSGAPDTDWPTYPYNDVFVDPSKMLLDQLRQPFLHHQLQDYHPPGIRTDYGTPILPSVFGVSYQLTDYSKGWVHHLGSRDEVRRLIDRGVPDHMNGLGGRCFETAQYYREVLAAYPKLNEAIVTYHPDMQGPFDVAHLIWGPDIFTALYDCPNMVHELLSLVTETYAIWMRKWKAFTGEGNAFTLHWNHYMKGGIMLRDDTAVTLSPTHYEEYVKPYDQILLNEFGGCIHYCGSGDHFVESMCKGRNLYGLNVSQPHLNDTELLLRSTTSNRIVLLAIHEKYIPTDLRTGAVVLR